MLTLYSGTPGAGKSLHVARTIYNRLRIAKRPVIATFPVNMDIVTNKGKKKTASFFYCDITDMSTEYLIDYALRNHKLGRENQTLVVIDECQIIFNPREFSRADRLKWIVFFTQHRKLGYDFVLISQFDRLIDRQIRCLLEYNVIHRKGNNLGLLWLLPIKFFVAVNVWYGAKVKCGAEFFLYRKKYGKMYDSFMMFDDAFKSFLKEKGDQISEFNRKVLGLDTPEKEQERFPEAEPTADEMEEIIEKEVSRYADILEYAEGGVGERSLIQEEVTNALKKIKEGVPADTLTLYGAESEEAIAREYERPETDEPSSPAEAPHGGAGEGALRDREEPPAGNRLARIWAFLNTPISFKRTPNPKEEA